MRNFLAYSVQYLGIEAAIRPACRELGIAVSAYSVLGRD